MAESTVVYTPDNGGANNMFPWMATLLQNRGIDPNVLYSVMGNNRGGWFGNDMFSSLIALIVVCGIFGNNGFGGLFGGGCNGQAASALGNLINNNDGREVLMNAITGNGKAISDLAAMLNTSISAVQQSLNGVSRDIQSVGNQVGMSGLQIVNAIQAGNADLASKFASCCCETKNAITTQGYENRLATLAQTDALSGKIADLGTMVNDKFCDLEKREMQNKIDALAQQNTILRGTIDNANQTAAIQAFVGQSVAPVAASLNTLSKEVDDIKCKLPATVNVPYPNIVAMSQGTAWNLLTGGGYGGYGYGGGFFGAGY